MVTKSRGRTHILDTQIASLQAQGSHPLHILSLYHVTAQQHRNTHYTRTCIIMTLVLETDCMAALIKSQAMSVPSLPR